MKGKFITFEGSEGSGKSTHSKLLCDYLAKKGLKVVHIREPGSTKISEKIRKILLDPANKKMSHFTELLLYVAARKQLVDEIIKPQLSKGKIVICDRFKDATIVYQGYALGLSPSVIENIHRLAGIDIIPDLTILLDLPTKQGLKRAGFIKDRVELRSYEYHLQVRRGYLSLARRFPKRIKIIKIDSDVSNTQQKIRELITRCLLRK